MPPKPLIHTNIDLLKTKLQKYEPIRIARRIGIGATVVIAVARLTYDSNIPILKEKHLDKYSPLLGNKTKKRKVTSRIESEEEGEPGDNARFNSDHARLAEIPPNRLNEAPQHQIENSPRLSPEGSPPPRLEDIPINRSDDDLEIIDHEHSDEEMLEDQREGELEGEEDAESNDYNVDGRGSVAQQSGIDQLVLTGPDEDEFRQYSDDDDDEPTTLSKNLKKIRTEPPPPPPQPKQVIPHQAPPRPSAPINIIVPSAPVPAPITTVAEIDKTFEQKNYTLAYAELERQKGTFKNDEAARSILKKNIFAFLERDDTFMLLKFLRLVFDYNYSCDTKFWDELVGKLRRKLNPHARCLTFKCDVEPKLVLHNYRITVRKIAEHFDSNNPTINMTWLNIRYLCESTMTPTSNNNCISSSPTKPIPILKQICETTPCQTTETGLPQENLDPATNSERDVSCFQDTDGKRKYKIRIPKGERKFSAII